MVIKGIGANAATHKSPTIFREITNLTAIRHLTTGKEAELVEVGNTYTPF